MVETKEEKMARENRLLERAKVVAIINRDSTVNRVRALANTASCVEGHSDLIPIFLVAAGDLESLWKDFMSHNQTVLVALCDLNLVSEFFTQLETEIRALYSSVKSVFENYSRNINLKKS
ncbi:Hypothetical protein CINCED_3A004173 [Cinara cedri]|uniref:Uncharacterized protein n=1 Tax=Cinara cedri TaxID=506608 RepID=A0A5E4MA62_9HEMI|nr:Hypothetical protein CINCED_3A004173 [Cinara cedri]